jgi:hypothetical protein
MQNDVGFSPRGNALSDSPAPSSLQIDRFPV